LPEEKKLVERAKARLPGVSLHKLSTALIQGLDENLDQPVKVFNIINTLNYPKFPQLVFPTEQWSHAPGSQDWHLGYINLVGIKYITQTLNLYSKLNAWKKQCPHEKSVICVHHIYLPMMLAANMMKKKYKDAVEICLITGDMNGRFGLTKQDKLTLKQRLIKYVEKAIDKLVYGFDSYVFATRDMATAYGVENEPYTVLECTYNKKETAVADETPVQEGKEKIIFYAGALRDDYGMPHLLRAFSLIEDPDYRLWLAGGAATDTIQKFMEKDSRIELLGFITPQDVEERQRRATALISPRTAEYEYVKYSFPSKTMECLASGKPYIAHWLPCDPVEYGAHIQYAENETDQALADKIVQICSMDPAERNQIGQRAKKFIVEEKNPKVMCKRIVDLWNRMEVKDEEVSRKNQQCFANVQERK